VFYLTVNLYHRALYVLRNYRYLGKLEEEIREQLKISAESVAFTRESTFYWGDRGALLGAVKWVSQNTVLASSLSEVSDYLANATAEKGGGKFVMAHLKDDPLCDQKIKDMKASVWCVPLESDHDEPGQCIITGRTVERRSVIAKAYLREFLSCEELRAMRINDGSASLQLSSAWATANKLR
jgi:hypothetical protein